MGISEKEQHELAVTNRLLRAQGVAPKYVGHGQTGEPDQIYLIGGRRIGVETTTAYASQLYAERLWDVARGRRPAPKDGLDVFYRSSEENQPTEMMLQDRIQQALNAKCVKRYQNVEEVWLCVPIHAVFEGVGEIDEITKRVQVPSGHEFSRIYLCFIPNAGEGGGLRVYDLLMGITETFYQHNRLRRWWDRRQGWFLWQWFTLCDKVSELLRSPSKHDE